MCAVARKAAVAKHDAEEMHKLWPTISLSELSKMFDEKQATEFQYRLVETLVIRVFRSTAEDSEAAIDKLEAKLRALTALLPEHGGACAHSGLASNISDQLSDINVLLGPVVGKTSEVSDVLKKISGSSPSSGTPSADRGDQKHHLQVHQVWQCMPMAAKLLKKVKTNLQAQVSIDAAIKRLDQLAKLLAEATACRTSRAGILEHLIQVDMEMEAKDVMDSCPPEHVKIFLAALDAELRAQALTVNVTIAGLSQPLPEGEDEDAGEEWKAACSAVHALNQLRMVREHQDPFRRDLVTYLQHWCEAPLPPLRAGVPAPPPLAVLEKVAELLAFSRRHAQRHKDAMQDFLAQTDYDFNAEEDVANRGAELVEKAMETITTPRLEVLLPICYCYEALWEDFKSWRSEMLVTHSLSAPMVATLAPLRCKHGDFKQSAMANHLVTSYLHARLL